MAVLTIRQGYKISQISFEAPRPLAELLASAGVSPAHPCGGRGVCGKCAVLLSGNASTPNAAEMRWGTRLSCQALITGDAEVILPREQPIEQIAGGAGADMQAENSMPGSYGAAIDIGTTTLALLLYDLSSGKCLGSSGMLNPQATVAADVIGRIGAAMKGEKGRLRQQAENAIATLLAAACAQAGIDQGAVESLTVTGNTTMLYLLKEYDPSALSHAPFLADHLFDREDLLLGRRAYFPGCLHAFIGADTTCAVLASGMLEKEETALLCDVGTNGEMALWHKGELYIASTAAGPAFEGAGIQCGCASISGAICSAEIVDGKIVYHTIGNKSAVGICGSGLVDSIALLLENGVIDESGRMDEAEIILRDGIKLCQQDIRSVQLAKAAVYAGIQGLLSAAGCTCDDVKRMYLAGGFGSRLNVKNAARIGLFPGAFIEKTCVIGNAALDGAALLLTNMALREKVRLMQACARHVRLDGNPIFSDAYIEAMMFEEEA
ncbi:MAG: DUF4445 domain-containing protein [Clostridiales bacterium]|nr:DUF4445 domain-containing protein [Clostridiales bacterium]